MTKYRVLETEVRVDGELIDTNYIIQQRLFFMWIDYYLWTTFPTKQEALDRIEELKRWNRKKKSTRKVVG